MLLLKYYIRYHRNRLYLVLFTPSGRYQGWGLLIIHSLISPSRKITILYKHKFIHLNHVHSYDDTCQTLRWYSIGNQSFYNIDKLWKYRNGRNFHCDPRLRATDALSLCIARSSVHVVMATLDHQILVVARFSFTCAIQPGMRNDMKIKIKMFLQTISTCNGLSLNCCTLTYRFVVVLWFGTDRFCLFLSGLFNRHWGNRMIYQSLGPCSLENFKTIWQLRGTLCTRDWNLGWVYGLGCGTIVYFNSQQHSPHAVQHEKRTYDCTGCYKLLVLQIARWNFVRISSPRA